MLLTDEYIDPAELTGYTRAALADLEVNRFQLARFLPSLAVDDLIFRFTKGGEGLVEAATFRAYDAESSIGKRPGAARVTGELPPISRKIPLGERDRLRLRRAGDDAFVDPLFRDAERMTRAVAARMELARGSALATGKVTIDEEGVIAEVDFGRQGDHTTSAGTPWSTTSTATVLSNLITWRDRYVATTGAEPGAIVTSSAARGYMQRNAEIINAITGSAAGRTRVNLNELQDLLASEGLPPVSVYDAQVSVNGAPQRIVPQDTLLMLPAPVSPDDPEATDLGATLWGTTAEALEPNYGLEGDEPGIVAGNYKTEDPIAIWTKASAIGLPVLANPNLSLAATVL